MPVTAQPLTEPTGFGDAFGGGAATASTAGSSGFLGSLTSDIVSQFENPNAGSGVAVATSMTKLAQNVAESLYTIDVTDPVAVSKFEADLKQIMDVGTNAIEFNHPVFGLMSGIADTAFAALGHAKADPFGGTKSIETTVAVLFKVSAAFEQVTMGQYNLFDVSEAALTKMIETYGQIQEAALADGITIPSLMTFPPADEEPTPMDEFIQVAASSTEADGAEDTFGTEAASLAVPSEAGAADDMGLAALFDQDPSSGAAELFADSTEPAAADDLGFGDLLGGDSTAEDPFGTGLNPLADPTDPAAADDLGFGDLLGGDPTEPAAADDFGLGELLGGDPTAEDPFADMLPDDADEGLSAESSTDNARSDQNQTNLEDRFINLYENLMEKQISFKERVEAFKTDNQNAGKG